VHLIVVLGRSLEECVSEMPEILFSFSESSIDISILFSSGTRLTERDSDLLFSIG